MPPTHAPAPQGQREILLSILKCNICQASSWNWHVSLECLDCGHVYRVVDNKPIMHLETADETINDATSHEAPYNFTACLNNNPALLGLNLGSGNTQKQSNNVINSDHNLYHNSDLSLNAHDLPFKNESFDIVGSFNVFEHLESPETVSREIHRVLKKNGRLLLHTAFIQPLHMEPIHYFNATQYGLAKWFANFNIKEISVPDNFSPLINIAWIASVIRNGASNMCETDRLRLENLSLGELADIWECCSVGKGSFWTSELLGLSKQLSRSCQFSISGGFELEAVK